MNVALALVIAIASRRGELRRPAGIALLAFYPLFVLGALLF
jgi:Ca2+/Na+ antiporter